MSDLKFRSDKDKIVKRLTKAVAVVTCILVTAGICFTTYMLKTEENLTGIYLTQVANQTASNLRGRIKGDLQMLEVLSSMFSETTPAFSETDARNFIEFGVKGTKFHRLSFTYPDGRSLRAEKSAGRLPDLNIISEPCFEKGMQGSSCFASISEDSTATSGYVNGYYVPVIINGKVVGLLGAAIDTDIFKKILEQNNFNGRGYSHIITNEGDFIIKSDNDTGIYNNFFDEKNSYKNISKQRLEERIKTTDFGSFVFDNTKGVHSFGAYSFLGYKNAYVLTIVPKSVLMFHIDSILTGICIIVLLIGTALLLLLRFTEKLYKDNEEAVYKVAFTDSVTDSSNKTKFILDAGELLEKNSAGNYAMIMVDITKFKVINELYGVKRANKILKDFHGILKRNLTKGSICARDFAATFAVLLQYDKEEFIVKYFVDKVTEAIQKYNDEVMPTLTSSSDTTVAAKLTTAFGIYLLTDKTIAIPIMCDRASLAKRSTFNNVHKIYAFYDDGIRAKILQDKSVEDEMNKALEENQFQIYLQPKFDMSTMEIVGAESLVRWIHPQRGIIPPMDFIPIFEKNGFIIELDKCVWEQTCKFQSERKAEGHTLFPISVNVSRLHLNNDAFIDILINLTKKYDTEPKYIELELTESACLGNEEHFSTIMNTLKSYGFTIAMDDFGTGYSSLNMLRRLPVDVLKLDRGFINDAIVDEKGKIVIRNILNMARELHITTVAEGIETPEQAKFLASAGCNIAQGFLYGRPLALKQFINTFLSGHTSEYQF